jgi:hypothetical protein
MMPRPTDVTALALLAMSCLFAASTASAAENTVIRQFLGGNGPNAVGMIDASEDTEIAGPQAIYSAENGDVYVLDQVNGRVLQFNPKTAGAEVRSYDLPMGMQPTDLVVRQGHIMVWDGQVHTLEPRGPADAPVRGLDEISTRDADDEVTLSTFAQMGSQRPDDTNPLDDNNTRSVNTRKANTRNDNNGLKRSRTRQAVASRGEGSVEIDVIPERRTAVEMDVRRKGEKELLAKLKIEVRDRLGAAEFLEIDHQKRMYVLAENVPPIGKKSAAAFVAQFSAQGKLEAIFDLPLSQSVALSRRFVTISPDGDVYFLRTRKNEVDIVGVGSRAAGKSTVIDGLAPAPAFSTAKNKSFIAAVRPLTRQSVVETAYAFEGVQWTVSQSAYGSDPDQACTGFRRIRRPGYLIGKLGQAVRGVPYCWGCHGSLAQIGNRIAQGSLAGNVCTHNAPRTDVVGVDCSAFVSAAWGLAQHFTTIAIPSITDPLPDAWDLRPGDALNKPGSHVMLFLRFTADRKAEVMEASPGACNGRVCRNVYPLASLLARGFSPVRYRALANDTVAEVETEKPKAAATGKATEKKSSSKRRHRSQR